METEGFEPPCTKTGGLQPLALPDGRSLHGAMHRNRTRLQVFDKHPAYPDAQHSLERDTRFELVVEGWKPTVLPLHQSRMAVLPGLEPGAWWLTATPHHPDETSTMWSECQGTELGAERGT